MLRDGYGNHARHLLEVDLDRRPDLSELARRRQGEGGADVGMAGERHLGGPREDADLASMSGSGREHEGGLGQVELLGDLLHLLIAQPLGLGQDSKLIAAEARVGEDIAEVVVVTHGRKVLLAV